MKLFLCKKKPNDVRHKSTAHPSEGATNWKKTNTRETYFPLQSIGKWKRQSGFVPKMIWKIDWLHREDKRTTNKEIIKKIRKETLKNLPDWRKRKRNKKIHPASRKNKRKEGKRLLINNIHFYILIYQNKKIKRKQNMNREGKYQKRTDARRHPYSCQIPKQSLQPDHSTPLHRQTQDTPTQGCSRDTAEQGIDSKTPD